MISMDFIVQAPCSEAVDPSRLHELSSSRIQEQVLLGDLILALGEVDCSARWSWIPILDLAACLSAIAVALRKTECSVERFEFTENAESILFERDADFVRVTPSYIPCSHSVRLVELSECIAAFRDRALACALESFPGFAQSPAFLELRDRCGLR